MQDPRECGRGHRNEIDVGIRVLLTQPQRQRDHRARTGAARRRGDEIDAWRPAIEGLALDAVGDMVAQLVPGTGSSHRHRGVEQHREDGEAVRAQGKEAGARRGVARDPFADLHEQRVLGRALWPGLPCV